MRGKIIDVFGHTDWHLPCTWGHNESTMTSEAPSIMGPITTILKRLHGDERGVAMVEYLEILVLVILGAAVAMAPLGAYLMRYYDNVEFLSGLPFP
jgi:Flp pilus assembly pilin Flp